jgi:hypothetical protein
MTPSPSILNQRLDVVTATRAPLGISKEALQTALAALQVTQAVVAGRSENLADSMGVEHSRSATVQAARALLAAHTAATRIAGLIEQIAAVSAEIAASTNATHRQDCAEMAVEMARSAVNAGLWHI